MRNYKKLGLSLGLVSSLSACSNFSDLDNSWCVEESKQCEVTTEVINLSADALFKFDRYKIEDLLPEGKKSLDDLALKVKQSYTNVNNIQLTGHTDRLGTDSYNYMLGLNRAKTIQVYLTQQGVNVPMNFASAGETQPTNLTSQCQGNVANPQLTACLQPDRRVVVEITGIKQTGDSSCLVKTEEINLAADALFKFDRYSSDDLLEKGKKTLDELTYKINNGYASVKGIQLVGHTDRLGSEEYNYHLGLNRAKTVRSYLIEHGVRAPIKFASAGETQPTEQTKECHGDKATPGLTACLQPDRRVVVGITGIRKIEK